MHVNNSYTPVSWRWSKNQETYILTTEFKYPGKSPESVVRTKLFGLTDLVSKLSQKQQSVSSSNRPSCTRHSLQELKEQQLQTTTVFIGKLSLIQKPQELLEITV